MSFWNDPVPIAFAGASANLDDTNADLWNQPDSDAAAPRPVPRNELDDLVSAGQGLIEPWVHEWDTTKAAFFDAIGAKVQASVAQSEGSYRASIERGDSLALRTYFNITSSVASGFSSAAGQSFTGPSSLVLDPADSVLGMGVAALDTGTRFALAGAEDKLHMLVNGATQLGTFAAMSGGLNVGQAAAEWRSVEGEYLPAAQPRLPPPEGLKASDADWHSTLGDDGHAVGQPAKPRPAALEAPGAGRSASEQVSAEAACKLTTLLGEGLYAPNSPAQRSAGYSPAPTPGDLSSVLGTGLYTPGRPASGGKKLDRDFSSDMRISPFGFLDYPAPEAAGAKDHYLKADLSDGSLMYSIMSSRDKTVAQTYGFGSEMVRAMMKAYADKGFRIESIAVDWNPKDDSRTNLDQFLGAIDQGLPATFAASQTFGGSQLAQYGFTRAEVLSEPSNWATKGVDITLSKPDLGDPAWTGYAIRLGTGVDRR